MYTFMYCRACGIAEEVGVRQVECPHCGFDRLRPATPREVLPNLPFMEQRAGRSAEEAATFGRALAFTAGVRPATGGPTDNLTFDEYLAYTADLYREMRGEAPKRDWKH